MYESSKFKVEIVDSAAVLKKAYLSRQSVTGLSFDVPPVPSQEMVDAIFQESWYHERGMQYFYFMPMELENEPGHMASATAYCTGTDGVKVEYNLLFMKEENEYIATLTGIKTFPTLKQ